MELAGLLSNPELRSMLGQVGEALANRRPDRTSALTRSLLAAAPQGQVLRTIRAVLLEHPEGLHVSEIKRAVEARLGRQLSRSTVKGALAEHAGPRGAFCRRKRGVYVLRRTRR
jgi:hypothetical protein